MSEMKRVDVGYDGRLFLDTARMVIDRQWASADLIQRRVRVGFVKAGRLMELLEDAGVVAAATGYTCGRREVLVPRADREAAVARLSELMDEAVNADA